MLLHRPLAKVRDSLLVRSVALYSRDMYIRICGLDFLLQAGKVVGSKVKA
jgi:hypothetical protein